MSMRAEGSGGGWVANEGRGRPRDIKVPFLLGKREEVACFEVGTT